MTSKDWGPQEKRRLYLFRQTVIGFIRNGEWKIKTWLSTYFFTLDVKYSVKLNAPPSESVLQNGAKIVLASEFRE